MRVERVTTQLISLPVEKPFNVSNRGQPVTRISHVLARVHTDDGLEGVGYAFTLNDWRLRPIKAMVDDIAGLVVGENPFAVEKIWQKLYTQSKFIGPTGLVTYAIAVLDIAMWDIMGKATGQPVYRLLGGDRAEVPVYASGLWRSMSLEELSGEARAFVEEGFTDIKMKVGGERVAANEVERVRVVREALGPEAKLMIDANQAWTPKQTVRMVRLLEPYDIAWLEDPLPAEDIEGMAWIASVIDVPMAIGEYHFTQLDLRRLLEAGATDIAIIDLQRAGGITEARKMASLAGAWHKPVASHVNPEINCHPMAAFPNALITEYMPWSFGLLEEPPVVKAGKIVLPQKPGLGFELDAEAIARYQMD